MNTTSSNLNKKGKVVRFYALLSIFFVLIFTYIIREGGFENAIFKFKQVAETAGSTSGTTYTYIKTSADGMYCVSVTPNGTTFKKILTQSECLVTNNGGTSTNTPDTSGATTTPGTTTPDTEISPDGSSSIPPFSITGEYKVNTNIYPIIFKSGTKITENINGVVVVKAELPPTQKAVLLIGTPNGWMTSGVISSDGAFRKIDGTPVYAYEFDSKTYADGYYKVGAAYYDTTAGWILTSVTKFYIKNTVVSTTPSGATTTPDINTDATTTPSIQIPTFYPTKSYRSNLNIFPSILKNGVRIFENISGIVSMKVEVPLTQKAILLIGTHSEWMTSGIISSDNGLKRVDGTSRYTYDFDSRVYADGYYRLGAAYYDTSLGWVVTAILNFNIKNAVVQQPIITTPVNEEPKATTSTGVVNLEIKQSTSSPIVQPRVATNTTSVTQIPTPTTATNITPIIDRSAPILRLVVNDRQITDLKKVFDSEELELRVVTSPASFVQFFAYSTDGKADPLDEIGWGGRDPLLSRDGKEVWTFTKDMNELPIGNYRLQAIVKYADGSRLESQVISIVVQHLSKINNTTVETGNETGSNTTAVLRENILERVRDPGSCQNRQECEVYCSNTFSAQGKCTDFVRVKAFVPESEIISEVKKNQEESMLSYSLLIPSILERLDGTSSISTSTNTATPEYSGRPSIVDIMPSVVIEKIIESKEKNAPDIPIEINSISDLQHYCGVVEHEQECVSTVNKIAPELIEKVEKQVEIVRVNEDKTKNLIEQRSGARVFIDSDSDGVTDYDEINFYGTNPQMRDTNGDGLSDGATILGQTSNVGEKIEFSATGSMLVLGKNASVENPKITGVSQPELFKITEVAAADMKETEDGKKEVSKISLKGVALPNSFVKIFLFSDPIVVTVKADDSGNWSYVLDKTLPDGTHTAYVAMSDAGGRILAKSEPLPFVKEASAITVTDKNRGLTTNGTKTIMGLSPLTLVALLVGILGLALSVVGVVIGLKDKKNNWPDITPTT